MRRFQMLGGILPVAGTTIVEEILALPVATAQLGLVPSLIASFCFFSLVVILFFLYPEGVV